MKLGKEIKHQREIEVKYDDDSGVFGKVFFDEDDKEWKFEGKWSDINEKDCFSIYNILKKLNKKLSLKHKKVRVGK